MRKGRRRLSHGYQDARSLSDRVGELESRLLESLASGSSSQRRQMEQLRHSLETRLAVQSMQQHQQQEEWSKDRNRILQEMESRTRRFERKLRQLAKRQTALAGQRDELQQELRIPGHIVETTEFLAKQARMAEEVQASKSEEIAHLTSELNQRQAEMASLEDEIQKQRETFQLRQQELADSSHRELEALQHQCDQLHAELEAKQSELTESHQRVEALEAELAERRSEYECQTQEFSETVERLQDELAQLQSEHAATLQSHQARITELQKELDAERFRIGASISRTTGGRPTPPRSSSAAGATYVGA